MDYVKQFRELHQAIELAVDARKWHLADINIGKAIQLLVQYQSLSAGSSKLVAFCNLKLKELRSLREEVRKKLAEQEQAPHQIHPQKTPKKEESTNDQKEKPITKDFPRDCREIIDKLNGKYNYSKLAGLDQIMQRMREAIELPLYYAEEMEELELEIPRGILMFGPPGCGKTFFVRCTAGEFNLPLVICNPAAVMHKFVGETPKAIQKIFQCASKVGKTQPSLIFVDEIEKLIPKTEYAMSSSNVANEALNMFLQYMDGVKPESGFIVISATNHPELMEPALINRHQEKIFFPPPDKETRKAILQLNLPKKYISSEVDYDKLAIYTEEKNGWFYAGRDLAQACNKAKWQLFNEWRKKKDKTIKLDMKFLELALEKVKRSVSPALLKNYKNWADQYASEIAYSE